MREVVGSRRFRVNKRDSDYDLLGYFVDPRNTHELRLVNYLGIKADYHLYLFENKEKLLSYIKENNSTMTNACLIYPGFRKFWGITKEELYNTINLDLLRGYERYYLDSQFEDFTFDIREYRRLYNEYKQSQCNKEV